MRINEPDSGWMEKRCSFFLANRHASSPMVAFSLLASCIGGTATIAMIILASRAGWPALWWLGSGSLGLAILGMFFAEKIRSSRAATLSEVIAQFDGNAARKLTGLIVLLTSAIIVAAQFNAMGLVISVFTGIEFNKGVLTGAAAIFIYTCAGGQKAVMKSDIWQFFLLAASLLAIFLYLLFNPLCLDALQKTPFQLANNFIPWSKIIYFLLIFGSSFIIGPMIFGRLLSASTPCAAKKGSLAAAAGLFFMAIMITAVGIEISGLGIEGATPEEILSIACDQHLPQTLKLLLIAGLLAAILSSADSCLLGAAVTWSNDIRIGGSVRETRVAMFVITICSILLVFNGRSILELLLAASDIYTGGIVGPTIILLLLGKKIEERFFLASIGLGASFGLICALTSNQFWSFCAIAVSCLISLCGLFLQSRENHSD